MKRIAVSLGLVAMGAPMVLVAATSDSLTPLQASKPWTVSASLRGFYDDNYTIANSQKRSSVGFEVSPSVGLNLPLEQTLISLSYIYTYQWFADRSNQGLDPADQSHQFSIDVTHAFAPSLTVNVHDDVVVAQEPQLLEPTGAYPGRAQGNNIRNTGTVTVNADVTQKFGFTLSYLNNYVSYDNHNGTAADPSLSGLLDRIEHAITLDGRYRVSPATTALIGYRFGSGCYTADEQIAIDPKTGASLMSSSRNYYSHYGFVGMTHAFTQQFNASVNVGADYYDFYNAPADKTAFGPYAELNASYSYLPGDSVTLGFREDRNPTDVVLPATGGGTTGEPTLDQESSSVYLSIVHKLTQELTFTATGNFQAGTFLGGSADGKTDDSYGASVDLSYAFNEHFSTDIAYYWNDLESDILLRSYSRNQIFLGVTGTF